jgi:hypothetical protein
MRRAKRVRDVHARICDYYCVAENRGVVKIIRLVSRERANRTQANVASANTRLGFVQRALSRVNLF